MLLNTGLQHLYILSKHRAYLLKQNVKVSIAQVIVSEGTEVASLVIPRNHADFESLLLIANNKEKNILCIEQVYTSVCFNSSCIVTLVLSL